MIARAFLIAVVPLALLVPPAGAQQQQQPAGAQQQQQQPTAQDRVAAVKKSLQDSMAALHQYEWVETTTVSMKGEEKSQTQYTCYYGADGKVQKVAVGNAPPSSGRQPRGLRGAIAANKKEDVEDSVHEAVALIEQYVPLDPAKIQAAKDAGKLAVSPPDAQGTAKLVISDYLKAGDSVAITVDSKSNRLTGVKISSYTDKEKDAVSMTLAFGTFTDGTLYPARTVLDVAQENLEAVVENSGYRKQGA